MIKELVKNVMFFFVSFNQLMLFYCDAIMLRGGVEVQHHNISRYEGLTLLGVTEGHIDPIVIFFTVHFFANLKYLPLK